MSLRISNPSEEGVYQASKWLKVQVLLDPEEMNDFLGSLAPFWIFPLTGLVDGAPISPSVFCEKYAHWIEGLKKGRIPSSEDLRKLVACAFTDDLSALWLQKTGEKFLTKIAKPIIQVQAHFFSYSRVDGVIRPMSMGLDSIFWGLQFSFPQVYQDPKTMELCVLERSPLFRKLQLWVRENTRPTPFLIDGKKMNSPIRIGRKCFSWIHMHPQLKENNIYTT